ncbi:MAG: hypothetical protein K0V04_05240, partial [Deltaproteobacteria bacterium]|nr:hypothetical protein [Deltaproteobacteria bacterium]
SPSPDRLRRQLSRLFPAVSSAILVEEQPTSRCAGLFAVGTDASRHHIERLFDVRHAAWIHHHGGKPPEFSAVICGLARPEPQGGMMSVLQNGAALGRMELPSLFGGKGPPTWLFAIVASNQVLPAATRQGIAMGVDKNQLMARVRTCLEQALEDPGLLRLLPRLQEGHGDSWWTWLEELPAAHPLRTHAVVEIHSGSIALHEVATRGTAIQIIHGSSLLAEPMWRELAEVNTSAIAIRLPSERAATVVCGTLVALGCSVSSSRSATEARVLPDDRGTWRLAQALEAKLSRLRIFVKVARFRTTSLLGTLETDGGVGRCSSLVEAARDLRRVSSARVLLLNSASPTVEALAERCKTEGVSYHQALLLVSTITAASSVSLQRPADLGDALLSCWASTTELPEPCHRRHGQIMVIGPFEADDLLRGARSVFESDPWYVEVLRADDEQDEPELWANVVRKIERADAFIVDLRRDNLNAWVEFGYAKALKPDRMLVVTSRDASDMPSDLRGHLALQVDDEPGSWTTLLTDNTRRFPQLAPESFAATEPFLSTRMLPEALASAVERLLPTDLVEFARSDPTGLSSSLHACHSMFARHLHRFRELRFS